MSKRSTTPPLQYAISKQDWEPHRYQKKAVKFLLEHAGAGLFLDPGLGKTSITLAALKILKKEKVSGKTIVIAPLRVCHGVWPAEVEKWNDFSGMKVGVLHGPRKEDVLWDDSYDILVINPEGLEWLFGVTKQRARNGKVKVDVNRERCRKLFGTHKVTDLVVDESTKFKRSSSQRFKILRLVLDKFRRRWILTGTPAPNGMMDLFGQMFIVDMGATLSPFITHYRQRFFDSVGFGGFNYRLKPNAEKEIYDLLKKSVLRLDAKDYLDLPDVLPNPIKFDLPEEARRIYDEMESEFVVSLEEQEITSLNAGSSVTKLAQIANGGLYKQRDPLLAEKHNGEWTHIHAAKDELVQEIVDELNGQPVMIAYEFGHDLERLRKIFGKDTPYIGGGVSAKRGREIEAAWNRGEIPVLLVQPASAGHGLNLQTASDKPVGHIVWYGLTYDYELYEQLIKRIARQGSKHKKVMVHMLIARDTVDVAKFYALRSKEKGQRGLLDALRVYVKERQRTLHKGTTAAAKRTRSAPAKRTPAGRKRA